MPACLCVCVRDVDLTLYVMHYSYILTGQEAAWASKLPFKKVAFVLSESDVGTAIAERMQQAIGAPGNGVNPTRRNKFLTNEVLRRRGAGE